LTTEQKQYKGAKIISSINHAGTSKHSHAKKKKKNPGADFIHFIKQSKRIAELKTDHRPTCEKQSYKRLKKITSEKT